MLANHRLKTVRKAANKLQCMRLLSSFHHLNYFRVLTSGRSTTNLFVAYFVWLIGTVNNVVANGCGEEDRLLPYSADHPTPV